MTLLDFTDITQNDKAYGGLSGRKKGVTYNGKDYLLKFPMRENKEKLHTTLSYSCSPLSEYIGSHVYEILGIPVHKTFLAKCNGKLICACEDFCSHGDNLRSFGDYKITFSPTSPDMDKIGANGVGTELADILQTIDEHPTLNRLQGVKERFWDMFVIDSLIGNPDRNNGNWGVLFHYDGTKELAPVYDCGNSFFHHWDDNKIRQQIINGTLTDTVVFNSGVCVFMDNGKKINPHHLIMKRKYSGCNKAVSRLTPTVIKQLPAMRSLINDIPEQADGLDIISPTKKLFFTSILQERVSRVLLSTYKQLQLDNNIALDVASESGKALLNRFVSTAVKHRRSMGLKESVDAACREIVGNDKAQAVIRKGKMDDYLKSIGKSDIMKYVTKYVKDASVQKGQHRSREGGYER